MQLGPHGSTALGACGACGGLGGLRGIRELEGLGGLGGRGCARRELRGGSREEGAERSSEVGCVVVFWALFQAHSSPFPLLEKSHFQPFSQDGHSLVVSTSAWSSEVPGSIPGGCFASLRALLLPHLLLITSFKGMAKKRSSRTRGQETMPRRERMSEYFL